MKVRPPCCSLHGCSCQHHHTNLQILHLQFTATSTFAIGVGDTVLGVHHPKSCFVCVQILAGGGLTRAEIAIVTSIVEEGRSLVVVANKADTLSAGERRQVLCGRLDRL